MSRHLGTNRHGTLLLIGGHEDKTGDLALLRAVADRVDDGALVVCTAASTKPLEHWREYKRLFRDLGVVDIRHLHVDSREEALESERSEVLVGACVVFITGGDQLRLTSQLGDTPVFQHLRRIFDEGGCIAGTSAGASVVCETMMVAGEQTASPRVNDALRMAPGFGLLQGVLVDQHFAERGRIGRLIGAVAQNPRIIGVGIDEDTAVMIEGQNLRVLGNGGVYILDGRDIVRSNVVEDASDRTLSVFKMHLHLLNLGDGFDLTTRVPTWGSTDDAERDAAASP